MSPSPSSVSTILCGMPANSVHQLGGRVGRQRPGAAAEVDRHQRQRRQLRREALGRRHADLGPGVRVQRAVRRARDRRVDDVADREDAAAAGARLLHRRQRVGGLAALRDGDDEVAGADDRIAVAELARQIDLARDRAPRPRSGTCRPAPRGTRCRRRAARPAAACVTSISNPSRSASCVSSIRRARSVSAMARGCSWISLSMKCG